LTREEIYSLETGKLKVRRIGRRDIATSIVLKESAVTKGSAAMLIAHLAGIKVLVTSDFQGVGLEAGTSYKVSPDIIELGRTPIAVICSGTANTMDVGKTLGV
jgi:pseudouridine-5'-phosphate glycosidase